MDTDQNIINGSSATILVVEDSSMNQMLLEIMLHRLNYNVMIACGGPEALEMLRKYHVDLVLSDIMMPEMNGYELLEKIRASKDLCHLPVLLMTAGGRASLSDMAMKAGADGFLSHPFSSLDLQLIISRYVQQPAALPSQKQSAII